MSIINITREISWYLIRETIKITVIKNSLLVIWVLVTFHHTFLLLYSTNRETCLFSCFPMWHFLSPTWALNSSTLIISFYFPVRWLNSLQSDFVGGFIVRSPGIFGWLFCSLLFFLADLFSPIIPSGLEMKPFSLQCYWLLF